MRNALPTLLILLAAGLGFWLLAGSEDTFIHRDLGSVDLDGAGDTSDPAPLEAPGMETREPPPPPRRQPPKIVDPRTIPRGQVDVLPVGPDLQPIPRKHLNVFVEPTGRKDWSTRLGHVDPETGVWSFRKILAGEVEIRVYGDHVIARTQRAVVKANETVEVTVHVDLAGAIQYDVVLYDKTRPEKVTLTLFDWEDKPVEAWYQARALRTSTSPRVAKTMTLGPEGVVFGVTPGHYRLRAVSENDEWDDVEVELAGGRTERVTFELRR